MPRLGNFSELVRDVLTLYLWICARGAEILAMEVSEISHEADGWWWTYPERKTKNARFTHATDQRVPLVGRALVVVQRRLRRNGEAEGYFFQPIAPRVIRRRTVFSRLCTGASPTVKLSKMSSVSGCRCRAGHRTTCVERCARSYQ